MNATESSVPIEWVAKELKGNVTGANGILQDVPLIALKNAKFVSFLFIVYCAFENLQISKCSHHGPSGTFTGFKFEVKPPILIDCIIL